MAQIEITKEEFLTDYKAGRRAFNGVILNGCDFSNMDICGIDLEKSTITNCNFSGANLRNADFTGVLFDGVNFDGANLESVYFIHAYGNITSAVNANFTDADLRGCTCFNGIINELQK